MKGERWQLLQTIFDDALALADDERTRFVAEASGGDEVVSNEVLSLLEAFESEPELMETPVKDLGLAAVGGQFDASLVGRTFGRYRVMRKLGGGGMGVVYLGEDTKLPRLVALKFLSPDLLNDVGARRQLRNEADLASCLNHPNICPVIDFCETDTQSFIVMPYVIGESLANLAHQNSLTAEEKNKVATQIVEAIAYAHANDTIHRDIKPGNVMLTNSGEVQVLDFGLAKIVHDGRLPQNARDYITNATTNGLILGTVAYMSPEQLKCEPLDRRTDVFSLGALLFEIFTGINPFVHESDAETIAAILKGREALPASLISKLPFNVRPVVLKCLEQGKDDRYASAGEVLAVLRQGRKRQFLRRFASLGSAATAITLIVILLLGIYLYTQWRPDRSVAVLPFANETADTSLDYLADGLAETIGSKLDLVDGFKAVPYAKHAGLSSTSANIGERVRADLVVTGRIFNGNGQLSFETRLIDTANGQTLRTATRFLDVNDIPGAEEFVLDEMFSGLELRAFTVSAEAAEDRGGTRNAEAFRQYLIGRHYWRKRDRENISKAIEAFQKAIDLDPGFSRAYARMADSYVLLNSVAYGSMPAREAYAKARAAARQALEIDQLNAEAQAALGVVLMKQDSNWAESERMFRVAIDSDPDLPSARYWYSGLLAQTGRADESITQAEKAKELDPFSPLTDYNLARTYYFARNFDRSLEILGQQTYFDPGDTKIKYLIGLNLLQKGSLAEALTIFRDISARNKMLGIAAEGFTLGRMGKDHEALMLIAELERESKSNYVPPQEFAFIYIGLNDKDRAFEYLNRAADERSNSLSALRVEPLFDSIRDDVRFAEILRKMGLDKL